MFVEDILEYSIGDFVVDELESVSDLGFPV